MHTYDTVTAAVNGLNERGFTIDFSLGKKALVCGDHSLNVNDFEITEAYRFEGNSDPADEAAVYAIEGKGLKGVLVTGYGISAEDVNVELLKKLEMHNH